MESKEEAKIRMRKYRKEYPEVVREIDKRSYHKVKKYKRRAKYLGNRRCEFCKRKLSAKICRMGQKKYCDLCLWNSSVNRYLQNLYVRRWRQKKKGLPQEPILFKNITLGLGRPPSKSIIIKSLL